MILGVWGGLLVVYIVIGGEVFLYMLEPVFEAGQSLGVKNVVTTIERAVVLGNI